MPRRLLVAIAPVAGTLVVAAVSACGPGMRPEPSHPDPNLARVAAMVGDVPITWADVQRRTRGAPFDLLASGCDELQGVVLDDMIDEELLVQEATRRGVVIEPRDVDQALRDMARGRYATAEEFVEASQRRGTAPVDLRRRVERRLRGERVLRGGLPAVDVSAEEARAIHRREALLTNGSFQVLFLQADTTDEKSYAARRALAHQLVAVARGGADFCEMVEKFGSVPVGAYSTSESKGCEWPRHWGPSVYQVVTSARPESAFELKDGVLSAPLEDVDGFFIVKVLSAGSSFAQTRASNEHAAREEALRRARHQWVARLRWTTSVRLDEAGFNYLARVRSPGLSGQICVRPGGKMRPLGPLAPVSR